METGEQLPSDGEGADVDIIGEVEDSNADARFSNNSNSSMAKPEIQTCTISADIDGQKHSEDESVDVDVIGDSSLPKNPADSASSGFHAQHEHALNLDHLDQQPGPSGVNNESNCILDIDSDSDDSIKIIDVPKKPVPVITVLDSSDDEEIDVVQIIPRKTLKAKRCPEINPPKSIKEKLEEQREKLFPVKTEENQSGKSPPTKHDSMCSICLGNCENRAFLDQCFHSFCYTCIIQWANIVHTCPLCKTSFKSIIHDVQPNLQYKQNFMKEPTNTNAAELPDLISFESLFQSGQRFRYRTTMTAISNHMNDWHRQARYEASRNRRPSRSRWGRHSSSSHHMNASEERRRSIYRLGMIVKDIKHPPGRVRFRDTSLRFFKDNPAITHRLVPWILRDLKVILDNNGNDASFVLHLIMSLLVRYPLESNEFHTELQPFLLSDTRQFIRELISFASSPYDMRTYDSRVVYDMPSVVQAAGARNDSTLTSSVLQRPSNLQPEREISFQDRLVDELFAGSRMEASPPLTRGSVSPVRTDILGHTGWNTDDSEIEITRVIPMMQVDNGTTTTNSSRNDRNDVTRSRDPRNDIATSRNQRNDIAISRNPRNDVAISRNPRNDIAISRNPRNDIAYVGKPKEGILVDCENMATVSSKKLLRRHVSKENNRHSYFTSGSSSSDEDKSRPSSKSRRADTSKQKKGKSKRKRRSRSQSYSRRRSPRLASRSNQDELLECRTSGGTSNLYYEPEYRDSHTRSSSKTSDYLKGGRGLERRQEALLDKERYGSSGPRSRSRDNHGSRSRSRHRPKSRPRTRSRSPSLDLLARRVRGRTPLHRSRFDVKERFLGGHRHRSSSNSSAKERNGMQVFYSPDDRSGFSRNRDGERKSRSPDTKLDHRKNDKNRDFCSSNVKSSHAKASEKQRRGKSGTPQEESFLEKLMKDAEQNESSSSSGKAGTYSRNHLVPSSRRSHDFKEQPQFNLLCDAFESDDDKKRTRSASKSSSSDYVKKHKRTKRKKEKKKDKEKKTRKRNLSDIDIDTGSEVSSDEEVQSNKSQTLTLNDAVVSPVVRTFIGVVDCDSEKRSDIAFTNKKESVKIGSDGSSVEIEEIKTRRKKKSKKQHKQKRHKHKRGRKEQDVRNFIDLMDNDRNDSDKESTRNFGCKPSDGAVNESDCQAVCLDVKSFDSNRGEALKEDDSKYDATAESEDLNQSKNSRLESKHTTDILDDRITDSERTDRGDETTKDSRLVNNGIDDFGMQESNRDIFEAQIETDVAGMKVTDLKETNSGLYIDEESSKQQKFTANDFEESCISDVVIEDLDAKMVPRRMNVSSDHSDTRARKCSGSNVSPKYGKQSLFSFPEPEEQNLNGDVNGLISSNESKSHGRKDGFGFEDLGSDITASTGNTAEKSFEIIQKDVKDALSDGVLETASSDNLSPHHQIDKNNAIKEMGVENIRQPELLKGSIANPSYRRPREAGMQEAEDSGIKPVGETRVKTNYVNCQSENCKSIIDDRSSTNNGGLETTRSLSQSLSVNTAVHKSESITTQNFLSHSKEDDSVVSKSSRDGGANSMSELHNVNREPEGGTVPGEGQAIDLGETSLLINAPQKSCMSKQAICSLIPPFSQHQEDTSTKRLALSATKIADRGANCLSPDARSAHPLYVNKQSTSSIDCLDKGDLQGTASERSIQSDVIETNQVVRCSLSTGSISPILEFIHKSNTSCSLGRQELEAGSVSRQSTNSQRTKTNLGAHRSLNTGNSSPSLSNTCSSLRREEQESDSSSMQRTNSQKTETNLEALLLSIAAGCSPLSPVSNSSTGKHPWNNIISRHTSQSGAKEPSEGNIDCFNNKANSAQMLNLDKESGIFNSSGNNEEREVIITEQSSGDRKLLFVDQDFRSCVNDPHLHINNSPNEGTTSCLISPTVPIIQETTKIFDYDVQNASELSRHGCTKDSVEENTREATGNERIHKVTDFRRKVRIISKRKTDSA